MRIRLFYGDSLESALSQMRAEIGEEAVLLSQQECDDGFEVRAAFVSEAGVVGEEDESGLLQDYAPEVRRRLLEVLRYHAVPESLSEDIMAAGRHAGAHDPQASLALGLQGVMECAPLLREEGENVLVTGLPGSGKTSIVARHARFRTGFALPPEPVSVEGSGNAARLGRLSGRYLVRSAGTPERLCKLLSGITFGRGYMIDGPGVNPRDSHSLDRLRKFLRVEDVTPVLSFSAEGVAEELEERLRIFSSLGVRDVVLTRIDLVQRLGPAIFAISSAGLRLGQLSWGSSVDTGLVSANHHRLAHLLLSMAPESRPQTLFKGVA